MKTTDCKPMWDALNEARGYLPEELYVRLCDTFCTFECGWSDHCDEAHYDGTFPPRREEEQR